MTADDPKNPGLIVGPPRYCAATPWSPLAAFGATIVVGGVSIFGAVVAAIGLMAMRGLPFERLVDDHVSQSLSWLSQQAIAVGLVMIIAGWFGGRWRSVLSLSAWPSAGTVALAFAGVLAIVLPLTGLAWLFARETVLKDLALFAPLARSNAWWIYFVVIAVGAPLSEEIAFRGFLQSALAQSRLRFWGGALIATILWTMLHASYSLIGLLEVFCIGLYMSWLLQRTGNLWVPILCHGLYNALVFLVIKFYLFPS